MNFRLLILFNIILIETFVELMIKAMDMEVIDWMELTPWKSAKLGAMTFILIFLSFQRWTPFIVLKKYKKNQTENDFSASFKLKSLPWFFFSSLFQVGFYLLFGFLSWKLNPNSFFFYGLLFLGAAEILFYLLIGNQFKLFGIEMSKNTIVLSKGELNIIHLNETQKIERKYNDEIYITSKKGKVNTINTRLLSENKMTDFLNQLKANCDQHNVYFANDLV